MTIAGRNPRASLAISLLLVISAQPFASLATTYISVPLEEQFADTPNLVEAVVVGSRIHTFTANGETRLCGLSYDLDVVETFRGSAEGRVSLAIEVYSPENTHLWGQDPVQLFAGGTYAIGFEPGTTLRDPAAYAARNAADGAWEGRKFRTTWDRGWTDAAGPCLAGLPGDRLASSYLVHEVVAPLSYFKRNSVLKEALDRRDCRTDYRGRLCRARYVEIPFGRSAEDEWVIGATVDNTFETTSVLESGGMPYLTPYFGYTSADDAKESPMLRSGSGQPIYLRQQGAKGDYQLSSQLIRYEDLKTMMRKPARKSAPDSDDSPGDTTSPTP